MRKAAAFVAVGVTAVAVRRYRALRQPISAIDPELRTPGMLALAVPFNRFTLPFLGVGYRFSSSPGQGVAQPTRHVGDVRVLVFSPTGTSSPRPAVLWIHGGGMCVGTPQIEAVVSAAIGREGGAGPVAPDYRPAPENPLPAGGDDRLATPTSRVAQAHRIRHAPQR